MQAVTCPHLDECPYRQGPKNKSKVSKEFKAAILSAGKPMYQIASDSKVAPAILSKAINDKYLFKSNDKRIARIALTIGFYGSCFEINSRCNVKDEKLN